MSDKTVNHFTVIESIYGKFIVNRHCVYQAETLIKTGRSHIEPELTNVAAWTTNSTEWTN